MGRIKVDKEKWKKKRRNVEVPEEKKLSNREIFDIYEEKKLLRKCVECQFAKLGRGFENMEDFYNDMVVWFLTYDNDKLNHAHFNKHINALLTRVIQNNLFSNCSYYWRDYVRFREYSEDLTAYLIRMEDWEKDDTE